ncbi:MAG: Arc family DNA-binding protein [Achromobacter sp.]|uniref:Arc family DNA-binding protein n=1 Tax=Achromobacter sp. TaxID=134375 RepID=UPI003CFF977D
MEDDRYTRITLRIPRDLHARLEAEAAATSKSMNAEIIGRVEDSFQPRDDGAELKPVLQATVALLDHKDAVIASHQRLIQLMGFYIGELAGRVQDSSPETLALMRFIQNFGRSMAEGKMRDAADHVRDIVEMGEEMGLIGNDEPADSPEAGREERRGDAFVDAVSEVVGVPLGRAGGRQRQAVNPPVLVRPIGSGETALTKAMATIAENINRPRTPKIPGVNAPKEGIGAAPKAEKPKREKSEVTKKRVFVRDDDAGKIKLNHTTEEGDE